MQNGKVDHQLGTMLGAKGRQQAFNNRSGNRESESKFKGGTLGFKHVVFTYGKGIQQGNWKEHLQLLSGIGVSFMKYGGACLARAIRTMGFQDTPKPNDPGEKASTLLKKKYERVCKKWIKIN